MRSSTLKWIVLCTTLLITAIIIVQLYWLKKVYSLEEKQFNTNVVKSIRGVFEDLQMNDNPAMNLHDLISNPDQNFFIFKADTIPEKDSLTFYLRKEFEDFNVLTDVKLGAYSKMDHRYIYEEYIPSVVTSYPVQNLSGMPVFDPNFDHILLYFPHRNNYILGQIGFWIGTSATLLITLISLAISVFYFYRQKFLAEIQKDFVNNFSHEFKTPLAVMKIAADVLSNNNIIEQPTRLERYASIIKNQTEHLQNQVTRLLEAASGEKTELPIEKQNVDAGELIEEAINKVQPLIEERNAKLEFRMDKDKFQIHADKEHLELAVVNLLENALKYSEDPKIVIEAGKSENDFYISIKDNGIGIEKKYVKNIFKKFYRIPTGDIHNVKGFGLGLNFVKRIIDAHNGKIKVYSLPGIGTEFRLFIPIN